MPRLRIIAGPNGSGKTKLTNYLKDTHHLNFGYYINADNIEQVLRTNGKISFRRFNISVDPLVFQQFYDAHPLRSRSDASFEISRNTFHLQSELSDRTYFPTLFSDFIRHQLLLQNETFSFETVMSDKRKLDLLSKAQSAGYKTYLYFICTEDVIINIDRVANRVKQKGHNVPKEKIISRYTQSLENLLGAIKLTDRAFLFDNSGDSHKLVAEIKEGKEIDFDPEFVPLWFENYVIKKLSQ